MKHGFRASGNPFSGAYDSRDLDAFKAVLNRILANLQASGSPLVEPAQFELTRVRVAAAIFQVAESGIDDPDRLQAMAEARLAAAGDGPTLFLLRPASRTCH